MQRVPSKRVKYPTMFKLLGPRGGVVNTARFTDFHDDPEKGRELAYEHIIRLRARWGAQDMFAGEVMTIVED